jgi:fructokinase
MIASASVVSLGEVLIDFVPLDFVGPIELAPTFHRAPGGAPANVAVALSRLGIGSAFIGKVGGDPFARLLRHTLADEGVEVSGLVDAPDAHTPLAFVGSDGGGGRSFVFYHRGMADTLLRPEEVDRDLIAHARIFHFGSVTLAEEPSRSATLSAAQWAHEQGCLVSFDPNVRLELWDSPTRALDSITQTMQCADLIKVSADELDFLTGSSDPAEACRRLRTHGPKLAVVTLGSKGCYYDTGAAAGTLRAGVSPNASDRTQLRDEVTLIPALRLAIAAGAITTTRYGAIPALPTRAEVDALLQDFA